MKFGGERYDTQFANSTGEKKKYFMHDMHKLAMDVIFAKMTANKGIKNMEKAVVAMYKEYTHLEYMKVMGALKPDSLTRSQKKGSLRSKNLIK